jgi:Glycosyltransferase sugar-binding region containing DXD motif
MIPRVLHYYFDTSADFGGKPWSLIHHACVRSAVERLRPTQTFFYCEYEPNGPWWQLTRPMVTVEKIKAPREIFGNPLLHVAHRADVVRLEKLLSVGGIYLDVDVFVHRAFDDLLAHVTVLGQQCVDGKVLGLCNAVILSEPQAPFLRRWHSEYRSFRSQGQDSHWDEHSVRLPHQLSKTFPDEVTILPHSAFFSLTFKAEDIAKIFDSAKPIDLSSAYATHLWETLAWRQYLEHLTPRRVRTVETNFHRWVRPMIQNLPDDYGAPTFMSLVSLRARRLRSRVRRLRHHVRSVIHMR